MDFTIEPDAAETMAEDAEDPEMEAFFREIAEGDEPFEGWMPDEDGEEFIHSIALSIVLDELQDNLDEITEDMTRYDAGRLRGVLETVELIHQEGDLPDVGQEPIFGLFPKAVTDEVEE